MPQPFGQVKVNLLCFGAVTSMLNSGELSVLPVSSGERPTVFPLDVETVQRGEPNIATRKVSGSEPDRLLTYEAMNGDRRVSRNVVRAGEGVSIVDPARGRYGHFGLTVLQYAIAQLLSWPFRASGCTEPRGH